MAATAKTETLKVKAQFPEKLNFLFEPWRYKVAHGGRGGGKSLGFGRALLIQGSKKPLRIVCVRETQESIADSVHQVLEDQIKEIGLQSRYTVLKSTIVSKKFASDARTEFLFKGLRYDPDTIKSLESADICWVEEGQSISKESFRVLIPTMRKERIENGQSVSSEIWVSFNPKFATDEVYRMFVANRPPEFLNGKPWAKVVKIDWRDNPWFPSVLKQEMEEMKARDYDEYLHVYEGHTRSTVEGAIYKAEITRAEQQGRITQVPYDPSKPVDTFWDLGYGDMVSIWFAQIVGMQWRVLDYYENTHQAIDFYLKVLQGKEYVYGTCVLPWDGGAKNLGSGRSIEELIRAKGFKARVLPQARVADGINAVRTIFPNLWFDSEKCQDGLNGLRQYQWGPPTNAKRPDLQTEKREPLHNAASHPADSLRSLAMSIKPHVPKPNVIIPSFIEQPVWQPQYTPFG